MKISVILATYNGSATIARALTSVVEQKGNFELEILVCDDYSTDGTVEIAKTFGAVVCLNSRHTGGPNAGKNNGLRRATGDCVAFLDQDDEWLPGKLSQQIEKIKEGYDVVSSSVITKHE